MAEARVDCLVAHVGTTGKGLAGTKTTSLQTAAEWAQEIIDAAKSTGHDMIYLAHGDPFATPKEVVSQFKSISLGLKWQG